eukprot:Anaeramoba_flamelloidesa1054005_25.p1 GENE.a1054005_25~~a1054005_25.p1  ORF type:complete len:497 (+),score=22.98 a1054005_25:27-1517(+)
MQLRKYLIIVLLIPITLFGQYNTTIFNTDVNEATWWSITDSNNDFVVSLNKYNTNKGYYDSFLYKFNPDGDTLFSRVFSKADTILNIHKFIECNTNPTEYIITGNGYREGGDPKHLFNYFAKIDKDFNVIWEKTYILRPVNTSYESFPTILQKIDSGFIYASNFRLGQGNLVLFEMSKTGDSLNYRHYESDSAGLQTQDVLYSYDSTRYQLIVYHAYDNTIGSSIQCLSVNFELEQTEVYFLPDGIDYETSVKLLPSGNMVTGGSYVYYDPDPSPPIDERSVILCKFNKEFEKIADCYIGGFDTDIRKLPGVKSMDFYNPNSIFFANTYDAEIWVWVNHPSWIVIGKADSSMNLLTEKYIGGDAYYTFKSITAASDGGILVGCNRYDYLTQFEEHDAYFYRFDSTELTVGVEYKPDNILHNAIVYPNPASEHITLRTTEAGSKFTLYNISGEIVKQSVITSKITKFNTESLPTGTYIWTLENNARLIEQGKIVISN